MFQLIIAEINWYDLSNYSHLGQKGIEKYQGAPLLFVLLNFLIFLVIIWYFVIPLIKKQLQERNNQFKQKTETLSKEYQELSNQILELETKLANVDGEIDKIQQNIQENIKQFELQIMSLTHQYIQSRHRETDNQIAIKKLRMNKKLRETILSQVVMLTYKKVKQELTEDLQLQLLKNTINALDKKVRHG